MPDIIFTSYTRVWDTTKEGKEKYLPYVAIRNLRNSNNKSSIQIVERITANCFLNKFKNNCTLSVIAEFVEDPTIYIAEAIVLEFRHCILVESQIANIGHLTSSEAGALDMKAVVDCDAFGRFDGEGFIPFDSRNLIKACISCGQLYNRSRFIGGCPSCGSPQE